jgi:hypothetical protein
MKRRGTATKELDETSCGREKDTSESDIITFDNFCSKMKAVMTRGRNSILPYHMQIVLSYFNPSSHNLPIMHATA